jgi:hypothetical protein
MFGWFVGLYMGSARIRHGINTLVAKIMLGIDKVLRRFMGDKPAED